MCPIVCAVVWRPAGWFFNTLLIACQGLRLSLKILLLITTRWISEVPS